jgi:hypothetical protein
MSFGTLFLEEQMDSFTLRDAPLAIVVSVAILTSVTVPLVDNAWGPVWYHEQTWADDDAMAYAPWFYMVGIALLLTAICIPWIHRFVPRTNDHNSTLNSPTPFTAGDTATLCLLVIQAFAFLFAARFAFALSIFHFVLMLTPTLALIATGHAARWMRRRSSRN